MRDADWRIVGWWCPAWTLAPAQHSTRTPSQMDLSVLLIVQRAQWPSRVAFSFSSAEAQVGNKHGDTPAHGGWAIYVVALSFDRRHVRPSPEVAREIM